MTSKPNTPQPGERSPIRQPNCRAKSSESSACSVLAGSGVAASWLNMAEIEIGALTRQCLNTRCETRDALRRNVKAWEQQRNKQRKPLIWTFTRQTADAKLKRLYVS